MITVLFKVWRIDACYAVNISGTLTVQYTIKAINYGLRMKKNSNNNPINERYRQLFWLKLAKAYNIIHKLLNESSGKLLSGKAFDRRTETPFLLRTV